MTDGTRTAGRGQKPSTATLAIACGLLLVACGTLPADSADRVAIGIPGPGVTHDGETADDGRDPGVTIGPGGVDPVGDGPAGDGPVAGGPTASPGADGVAICQPAAVALEPHYPAPPELAFDASCPLESVENDWDGDGVADERTTVTRSGDSVIVQAGIDPERAMVRTTYQLRDGVVRSVEEYTLHRTLSNVVSTVERTWSLDSEHNLVRLTESWSTEDSDGRTNSRTTETRQRWTNGRLVERVTTSTEESTPDVAIRWTYDSAGRLASASLETDSDEPGRIQRAAWTYDGAGRPSSVVRTYDGEEAMRQTWTWNDDGGLAARSFEMSPPEGFARNWLSGGLDTFEPRVLSPLTGAYSYTGRALQMHPWPDASFSEREDCWMPPTSSEHGYPVDEADYALGWEFGTRPPGIGAAYLTPVDPDDEYGYGGRRAGYYYGDWRSNRSAAEAGFGYVDGAGSPQTPSDATSADAREASGLLWAGAYPWAYIESGPNVELPLSLDYDLWDVDALWYGHVGLGTWSPAGVVVAAEQTYSGGRMVEELLTTRRYDVEGNKFEHTHHRVRSFGPAGLESDRVVYFTGEEIGRTRELRFHRDDTGRLVRRELHDAEGVIERQHWAFDDVGRVAEHRTEVAPSLDRLFGAEGDEVAVEYATIRASVGDDERSVFFDYALDDPELRELHVEARYDSAGRLAELLVPVGWADAHVRVTIGYDPAGRPVIEERDEQDDGVVDQRVTTSYDADGRTLVESRVYGTGAPEITRRAYACGP